MLAITVLMVWWALRKARHAKSELSWPTVVGLVSRSEVVSGKIVKPKILYSYSFDGREYTGKVIQSNMVFYSGRKSPQLLCQKFPIGSRPIVYVNARDPRRAVLIPGGDRTFLYFVFAIAAFLLLTHGLMAVMMIYLST